MTRDVSRRTEARSARLEVIDRLPRSVSGRYALVDRKLRAIYEPPASMPERFRALLEELDRNWSKPDVGQA